MKRNGRSVARRTKIENGNGFINNIVHTNRVTRFAKELVIYLVNRSARFKRVPRQRKNDGNESLPENEKDENNWKRGW